MKIRKSSRFHLIVASQVLLLVVFIVLGIVYDQLSLAALLSVGGGFVFALTRWTRRR